MVNRNYIIDRLLSRTMTINEFNFDRLQAPPILSMFSPQDVAQLDYIATSLKYSARPREKYQEIDYILRNRGFEKFIAGTNRVAYRALENSNILVKVAYDDVGRSDSVREFRNQMIFKPFVTKIFDVSPNGTLSVVERCIPITNREEFLSVAEDIFEVINQWFVGEYVLEDIGTKFFQNWSIRKGFGPVLHDFPYVYKIDGKKLFCTAPNPMSPTGRCDGIIDYDGGYNFLYCTKCGALYRGKELEETVKENNIIIKSEGEIKMKVRVKGGSNNLNRVVTTGEYSGLAKKIPTTKISEKSVSVKDNVNEKRISLSRNPKPVKEVETVVAAPTEKLVYHDNSKNLTISREPERTEVISPITIDPNKGTEKPKSNISSFEYCLKRALEVFERSSDEEKSQMSEMIKEGFKDAFDEAIKEMNKKQTEDDTCEKEESITIDRVLSVLNSYIKSKSEDEVVDLAERIIVENKYLDFLSHLVTIAFNYDVFSIVVYNRGYYYNEDDNIIMIDSDPYIITGTDPGLETREEIEDIAIWGFVDDNSEARINVGIDYTTLVNEGKRNVNESVEEVVPEGSIDVPQYSDSYQFVTASVINTKDILPNYESAKILILKDEDGKYIINNDRDREIIAISDIDDKSVNSLSIVSKHWLEGLLSNLGEDATKEEESEEKTTQDEVVEEVKEEASIPTGVLPPTSVPVGVNGVIPTTESEE